MPTSLRRLERQARLARNILLATIVGVLIMAATALALIQHLIPVGETNCALTAVDTQGARPALVTSCGTISTTVPSDALVPGHVYTLVISGIWSTTVTEMHDLTVSDGIVYT